MSLLDLIPKVESDRPNTAFGSALASEQLGKVAQYVEAKSVDLKRVVIKQHTTDRSAQFSLASAWGLPSGLYGGFDGQLFSPQSKRCRPLEPTNATTCIICAGGVGV
jgi:hypothetical protein